MGTLRVLVVEDNPIARKLMRVTLHGAGYIVLEAPDGRTAIELMSRHAPDLVLQDLVLPDTHGFELVKRLRALPGGAGIPIIAVSGSLPAEEQVQSLQADFTDYLFKPVSPSRLLEAIQAYLRPSGEERGRPGGGRHILAVDDDPVNLKLLRVRLEGLGFRVTTAADGAEALEQGRASPPDAIVSDVMMPRLDGLQFCAAVRQDPRLTHVPVVLTSAAYTEEADRRLAEAAGANTLVLHTPDLEGVIKAIFDSLEAGPPPVPPRPAELPVDEYTRRVALQLERHVALNLKLTRRLTLAEAELMILVGVADALASAPLNRVVLSKVLEYALNAAGVSRGVIYLLETDGHFSLQAQVGYPDSARGWVAESFGHADLLRRLMEERETLVVPSSSVPGALGEDLLERAGTRSMLLAPILSGAELLGALVMASTKPVLTEEWIPLARGLGAQIGQAVRLEQVFGRLARLSAIVEATSDLAGVASRDGRLHYLNHAGRVLLGIGADEDVSGMTLLDIHPERLRAYIRDVAIPALVRDGVWSDEVVLLSRDGREIPAWAVGLAHRSPDGGVEFLSTIIRDLSERKRTEERLRQVEKLSMMGQLLAGVAHELNNPLSVVLGQAALLRQVVGSVPLAERAEKITRAAERCARIVRNFLALARHKPVERQRVRLNQVVREAVELLAYPLRVDNVEATLDLAEDLPVLWADPHQLHQVVVNLITNAHQAMRETPGPRRLRVTTRFDAAEGPEGRVFLDVADTGPGIPPEVQRRLFEPFFTTKPGGQGTGLGLSICQGILETHDGSISVESQLGHGAIFRIALPVKPPPPTAPEPLAAEVPSLKGRKALVVDDEPEIASLLADLLALEDHQVETATSGALALEKLRQETYDFILSDIKMPEMDGPDLYRELQRRHPRLAHRVIFVTGDLLTPSTRDFLERTGAPSVSKPFVLEEVRRAVQRVLRAE